MVQFCYKGLYLGIENVFLSCVATDGKDEHGLKRENVGPTFYVAKCNLGKVNVELMLPAGSPSLHMICGGAPLEFAVANYI